jgi:thiol-disulfide isomerase/thioredoxin
MKKRNLSILLAFVFVLAGVAIANEVPAPPAIGSTIEDFTLPDVSGADRSLKSLAGKNGTVLLFIAVQCPVSNAYNERMEKLAQDYKAKGIAVIGINSNVAEDADAVRGHAAEHKAYFLDGKNKLVYHGRIDNSRNAAQVESNDLRNALDAALGGKPIEKTEAKAFGCSIKRG